MDGDRRASCRRSRSQPAAVTVGPGAGGMRVVPDRVEGMGLQALASEYRRIMEIVVGGGRSGDGQGSRPRAGPGDDPGEDRAGPGAAAQTTVRPPLSHPGHRRPGRPPRDRPAAHDRIFPAEREPHADHRAQRRDHGAHGRRPAGADGRRHRRRGRLVRAAHHRRVQGELPPTPAARRPHAKTAPTPTAPTSAAPAPTTEASSTGTAEPPRANACTWITGRRQRPSRHAGPAAARGGNGPPRNAQHQTVRRSPRRDMHSRPARAPARSCAAPPPRPDALARDRCARAVRRPGQPHRLDEHTEDEALTAWSASRTPHSG